MNGIKNPRVKLLVAKINDSWRVYLLVLLRFMGESLMTTYLFQSIRLVRFITCCQFWPLGIAPLVWVLRNIGSFFIIIRFEKIKGVILKVVFVRINNVFIHLFWNPQVTWVVMLDQLVYDLSDWKLLNRVFHLLIQFG